MSATHLNSIHSEDLHSVLDGGIDRLMHVAAEIAQAHVVPPQNEAQLGPCWWDDGESICREAGTVHLLGSDLEYCEYHARKVIRGV